MEPTRLAISHDGKKWIDVGAIAGGTAQVDIGKFVRPGESFTYVRLTDNKSACHGGYPERISTTSVPSEQRCRSP